MYKKLFFTTLIFLLLLSYCITTVYSQEITGQEDNKGPVIRFTRIEAAGEEIIVEGYTVDNKSNITFIGHTQGQLPDYKEIDPLDGLYDEMEEEFSFSVPKPKEWKDEEFYVKITDEFHNVSYGKISMYVRDGGEYFGYLTYLSESALDYEYKDYEDIFRIYYSPDTAPEIVDEVLNKMSDLKSLADKEFGMKYYDEIHILIFNPLEVEKATFNDYRGIIENDIFTFPVPTSSLSELKEWSWVLDNWISHELGDHSTRHYFSNEWECRWLSEGMGDLLNYLFVKEIYPEEARKIYKARIDIFRENCDNIKTVNLICGDWGHEYYLCSVAFAADIYKKHGTEIFKKVYEEYNKYPRESLSNEEALKIFSEVVGYDVVPVLENYSTEEAIEILEEFSE